MVTSKKNMSVDNSPEAASQKKKAERKIRVKRFLRFLAMSAVTSIVWELGIKGRLSQNVDRLEDSLLAVRVVVFVLSSLWILFGPIPVEKS